MHTRTTGTSHLLATAILMNGIVCATGCSDGSSHRPSVLLIAVDTLRADHLSCLGYPWETSPRIDALAESGALFENCIAQGSWTMPSMTSFMTGRSIFTTVYKIPDSVPVLAESFRDAGYRTGAFVGNSLLAEDAGFARGFETFGLRKRLERHWTAEYITDRAVQFLGPIEPAGQAVQADDRPFFLWLHYMDPHTPYEPPEVPFERTVHEIFADFEIAAVQHTLAKLAPAEQARLRPTLASLAEHVDRYDGEVLRTDKSIGALLAALEERGLDDSTFVVLVADHGETLFRRPETGQRMRKNRQWKRQSGQPFELADVMKKEHTGSVFQELVRTPWIVSGPGVVAGVRIPELVSNLDVGPTILGLCGLQPMGEGRDLSRTLLGIDPMEPAPWATSYCPRWISANLPDGRKLVIPGPNNSASLADAACVYDLVDDPHELSPQPVDGVMERVLGRLLAAIERCPFREYGGESTDPETVRKLKELGYIR